MDSVHTTTDLDICDNTTPADAGNMDMLDVSGSGKKKRKHKKKKTSDISVCLLHLSLIIILHEYTLHDCLHSR